VEKKPFARLKEDVAAALSTKTKPEKPKKKEKPPKKLTKSKSTEQQPQTTPTFGATVSFTIPNCPCQFWRCENNDSVCFQLDEAIAPNGILERCVKFIEEEGLEMEGTLKILRQKILRQKILRQKILIFFRLLKPN
jgi:hypothetical protein